MKTKILLFLLALSVTFAAAPGNNSNGGGFGGGNTGGTSGTATKPTPDPVAQLLLKYDLNHDGKLDSTEIKLMAQLEQSLAQELKPFDLDHNFKLDAEELARWAAFKKAGGSGRAGGA